MIHGVDTESHGGPAEFGGPFAAPWHRVVGGVAEPDGVADRDERSAEQAFVGEAAEMGGRRGEAHLEHTGSKFSRAPFGGFNEIEFGERRAKRFFTQHPGSGLHGGDAHGRVEGGRRGDEDQIGLFGRERGSVVGVEMRELVLLTEGSHAVGVDVDGGREHDTAAGTLGGADVGVGDAAGADKNGAVGLRGAQAGSLRWVKTVSPSNDWVGAGKA